MRKDTGVLSARLPRLLGRSRAMAEIQDQIQAAAGGRGTILLLGESGTGKELAARTIHSASPRCGHPFMVINCAAYAPTLLESELFGHERGAFSGATETRIGRFEAAHLGIVFIDEVGDLSIPIQLKLLRVLQSYEIERVGSNRTIRVDVRIIAATNRDLEKLVAEGHFREDLYQRLHGIVLRMPPLRDRGGDVRLIAESFLAELCEETGRIPPRFSREAFEALDGHSWPGNVRELRNTIERIMNHPELHEISRERVLKCLNKALRKPHSSLSDTDPEVPPARVATDWSTHERTMILQALRAENWRIGRAARRLGWSRFALARRMKKHDLRP